MLLLNYGDGGGLVAKSCKTLAIPRTVACQAPLSMGFSRQEYWSGLPFPSFSGHLLDPGIEPGSSTLQADSLPTELRGKPHLALAQANHVDHISYKGDKQGQPGFMLRNKIGNIS